MDAILHKFAFLLAALAVLTGPLALAVDFSQLREPSTDAPTGQEYHCVQIGLRSEKPPTDPANSKISGSSLPNGGLKRYADVLMLNLSNELIFTVANRDSAIWPARWRLSHSRTHVSLMPSETAPSE